MQQLIAFLVTLPLVAFWFWMGWEMANNNSLPRDSKYSWLVAFLFLNFFAAIWYYLTEYRRKY